jgi:hypothetical protein
MVYIKLEIPNPIFRIADAESELYQTPLTLAFLLFGFYLAKALSASLLIFKEQTPLSWLLNYPKEEAKG